MPLKFINDASQMMFINCDVVIVLIFLYITSLASNTFLSRTVFGGFCVDGSLNVMNSRVKK